MMRYALRRLSFLPLILLVVSIFTFVLLRVLPSADIADVIGGSNATPQQKAAIRARYGLLDPIFPVTMAGRCGLALGYVPWCVVEPPVIQLHRHSQYGTWLLHALRGDFGTTYTNNASVRAEFLRRFPASFELVSMSLAFGVVFGISFGILSAMYRNSLLDYAVRIFSVAGTSIPEFFLLTLLIIIPSYLWNYAQPAGGYVPIYDDPARNLRLFLPPALILGLAGSSGLMRLVRTTMLEVLRSDYVRTARAKGLPGRVVVLRHALRNAGTPILTAIGTAFIAVFGGSLIAERILSIQGIGLFFFTETLTRDLPAIQFLAVYTAAVVVLVNLVVDLSYAWADPRVKYS
ncbi:MAG TPA: ABC transporter permease [Dehalococcoidia bacterium]|nr:ABC transporter permease [Dehalococcoidia bacterium]